MRHEGLLRFFFADVVDPDDQLELVRTMREMHERTRDEMRAIRPKAEEAREERGQEFPLRTLEFGIAYQDFVIEWCSQLERELGGRSSTNQDRELNRCSTFSHASQAAGPGGWWESPWWWRSLAGAFGGGVAEELAPTAPTTPATTP